MRTLREVGRLTRVGCVTAALVLAVQGSVQATKPSNVPEDVRCLSKATTLELSIRGMRDGALFDSSAAKLKSIGVAVRPPRRFTSFDSVPTLEIDMEADESRFWTAEFSDYVTVDRNGATCRAVVWSYVRVPEKIMTPQTRESFAEEAVAKFCAEWKSANPSLR